MYLQLKQTRTVQTVNIILFLTQSYMNTLHLKSHRKTFIKKK